ncbi:hypothetical protein HaLaN_19930 [Haematococcus lacustris]|uniref:Uncharacterized protein n=1 Tax=Haematococcus lacustris TaxID=44745 RepID=A0A699ZRX1_HAELA|nr:hypothetical protein HaLaN_19930 [Haematococcus lacustris]
MHAGRQQEPQWQCEAPDYTQCTQAHTHGGTSAHLVTLVQTALPTLKQCNADGLARERLFGTRSCEAAVVLTAAGHAFAWELCTLLVLVQDVCIRNHGCHGDDVES